MGATIFPAVEAPYENERGMTGYYLESVAPKQTIVDEQFGTFQMAEDGYEMHLTYGSVYAILDALGYEWDTESYSGKYEIRDVYERLMTRPHGDAWQRLAMLKQIVTRGMDLGATHIGWA